MQDQKITAASPFKLWAIDTFCRFGDYPLGHKVLINPSSAKNYICNKSFYLGCQASLSARASLQLLRLLHEWQTNFNELILLQCMRQGSVNISALQMDNWSARGQKPQLQKNPESWADFIGAVLIYTSWTYGLRRLSSLCEKSVAHLGHSRAWVTRYPSCPLGLQTCLYYAGASPNFFSNLLAKQ